MMQIREQLSGGVDNISAAMEELRPILDVQQAATLDQLQKEFRQIQEMTKKHYDSLIDAKSGRAANPAP
jgi:hypothetical protein